MLCALPVCYLQAQASWPKAKISRRTAIVEVVEKIGPAIVNISTERLVATRSPFFNDFFGRFHPRVQKTHSLGSGVVIDSHGFIVTNHHVIARASKINITLDNEKNFYADLIASNEEHDLALLKIDSPNPLTAISWGDSDDILIGETAIALGNPFGLQNSVTTGVISATDRTIAINNKNNFSDFIQTDTAINPGNSGGALLNIHGQLVGINTAIYSQGQGLGFAIPIKRVRKVVGELLNYRNLKQLWLGLKVKEISRRKLNWLVKVTKVTPHSPAHLAKIMPNDEIVAVDNNPVQSLFDFRKFIYAKNIGDSVTLQLKSKGQMRTLALQVAPLPLSYKQRQIWQKMGVMVQNSSEGVMVTKIRSNSSAGRIGIETGDILVAIGGYRIRSVREFKLLLGHLDAGDAVSIVLIKNRRRLGGTLVIE